MKQTTKIQLGLEDPKQATIHLALHSDLFLEFQGNRSLGLKTISYGVFLFVDDCLIADWQYDI